MRLAGFVGPTYQARSLNADAERCINLFPERVESGAGVNSMYLLGTPGLAVFATLTDGPIRAMFSESGRCFAVAGVGFFEIFTDGTFTRYGSVANDATNTSATISSNGVGGLQLMIISGGEGYIFNTSLNTLTEITDVNFPTAAFMGSFVDSYFVVLDVVANTFQLSALNDGLTWDGLDVAQRSFSSDPLKAFVVDHRELWFLGESTTEVWVNSGNLSFPFQPIQGTHIEDGIAAPWSLTKIDNSIMWLQGDERGDGMAMKAQGYTPTRISTHAVEQKWKSYAGGIADAIGYGYQQDGHTFWVLYFPQGDTSWAYDVSTGMWHERALWDPDLLVWVPHLSRAHAFAFSKNLVGDRQSTAIYNMSLDLFDEQVLYPGLQ